MGKLYLNKAEFTSFLKTIVENVQLEYDEMDYYSAFFDILKDWLRKNIPENELGYPIGFLLKKYQGRFLRELTGDDEYTDDYEINRWEIEDVVKKIIENGHYTLPSMYREEKFTEKYTRAINFLINGFNLPSWAKVYVDEEVPNYVKIGVNIDFPKMIKDDSDIEIPRSIPNKLIDGLKEYFGVESGNPAYGFVNLQSFGSNYQNVENWSKTELKKIKDGIKKIPNSERLQSIRFFPEEHKPTIKLVFKRDSWEYTPNKLLRDKVEKLVRDMGYPEKRLRVSIA